MRISRTTILMILVLGSLAAMYVFSNLNGGGGGSTQFRDKAAQAVAAQGYTDIVPTGVDIYACGDPAGYSFQTTNSNGVRVNLVACNEDGLMSFVKGYWIVTKP